MDNQVEFLCGDVLNVLKTLPEKSVQCVVTSPPYYGLRDYGIDGQIGLEETPEKYVNKLVLVFREVRKVLKDDGVLWLNLGDSYAGSGRGLMGDGTPSDRGNAKQGTNRGTTVGKFNKPDWGLKPKDLIGIPWMVAFALRADGWWLRSDVIWNKTNPMPESVTDRPTKAHEYIFLLTKSAKYYYDAEAIKEPLSEGTAERYQYGFGGPEKKQAIVESGNWHTGKNGRDNLQGGMKLGCGRNKRSVWTVSTKPYKGAHFATFPPKLIEPCILAGSSEKGQCPKCGKAWVRVLEKAFTDHDGETKSEYEKGTTANRLALLRQAARREGHEYSGEKKTLGWEAQCNCDEFPVPQIVLDPFSGSGTTGQVAVEHCRNYIGIELNPKYIELSKERLEKVKR